MNNVNINNKQFKAVLFDDTSINKIVELSRNENVAFKHSDNNMVYLIETGSDCINIVDFDQNEDGINVDVIRNFSSADDILEKFEGYYGKSCFKFLSEEFNSTGIDLKFKALDGSKSISVKEVW